METKPKRGFLKVLKSNVYLLAIFGLALFYVFYGLFEFKPTEQSAKQIVGSIVISLTLGTILLSFLRRQGLKNARDSEVYQNSLIVYAEAKEKAKPNLDKLAAYCAYKTEQEKTETKRDIITSANLSYAKYKAGFYDEIEVKSKLDDDQKKAINKANSVKVNPYQAKDVLSDLPKNGKIAKWVGYGRYGRDDNQYDLEKTFKSILSKLLWAFASGLYTLAPLNRDNIPQAIWNGMQILMWLAFGSTEYFNAKEFVLNEYRQTHIIQKTALLDEFNTIIQNDPHRLDKYDDDLQFEKYLKEKEEKVNEHEYKQSEETKEG